MIPYKETIRHPFESCFFSFLFKSNSHLKAQKTKQKNQAYIFNVKQTKRKKKKERQLIITRDYEHPSSNNKTECLDVLFYSMSGRINSFFSLLIVFFRQMNTIYL